MIVVINKHVNKAQKCSYKIDEILKFQLNKNRRYEKWASRKTIAMFHLTQTYMIYISIDINTYISVNSLNTNEINYPIKGRNSHSK